MRVFKFGGASVKDAAGVKNLASIVGKAEGRLVVVVSAMGKITNALEELIRLYVNKDDKKWEQLTAIKNYHTQIMEDLFDSSDPVFSEIDSMFFRIEDRLHRLPSLNFNFEYDQFIGYGELLSTKIVSAYLIKSGIKNKWIDIRFSLKTDDKWREANVDEELSAKLISQEFSFADEKIYLTQGFIGATNSDLTTSLGREGSDYTAAILGSILKGRKGRNRKGCTGHTQCRPTNTSRIPSK